MAVAFLAGSWLNWVLPGVLVLAWLTFWVTRRWVPPWFFVVGTVLVVLCVPAGVVARHWEMDGRYCGPENLCFATAELRCWLNGLLGLFTIVALSVATLLITSVLDTVRRARFHRVSTKSRESANRSG